MSDIMMSVSQVAKRLGLSVAAIRDAVARGDLAASRLGGRVLRIPPESVDAWLERTRVTPRTTTPADERQLDLTTGLHDDPVIGSMLEPTIPSTT